MKSLLSLQPPPLQITISFSPLNPTTTTRSPLIIHPTRTIWKLKAEAKGFSNSSASIPKKKITNQDETTATKLSSGKNDGNDDDEQIPQVVFERIIVRILVSVGVPLAIGVGFLNLFGVVKEQHVWDVPTWVPALTTFLAFGSSALGIAYGTLSTSWDASKNGSFLGVEEAQRNWVEMWREEDESKR